MSLNKFTDSSVKNAWMNINCNDLKATTIDLDSLSITDYAGSQALDITETVKNAPVLIRYDNTTGAVDQRQFALSGDASAQLIQFSANNDSGMPLRNLIVLNHSGAVTIPSGSLDIGSNPMLNVGSSASAGSFYEVFTTSGNVWSGAIPNTNLEYTARRVGGSVTVSLGFLNVGAIASSTIVSSIALPVSMRPNPQSVIAVSVRDNSNLVMGAVIVGVTGALIVYGTPALGPFTNSGNAGWGGLTFSYGL